MIPSSRTFDKDCDGKLKPEELLGILTWDNSKLPEGLQEVIEEFQDSDGLIFYEGTLNNMYVKHTFLIYLKVWLVSWRMVGLQRPKMPECITRPNWARKVREMILFSVLCTLYCGRGCVSLESEYGKELA